MLCLVTILNWTIDSHNEEVKEREGEKTGYSLGVVWTVNEMKSELRSKLTRHRAFTIEYKVKVT